jgi:energy-coupling factor transport system ATP-binding protein
MLKIPIANVKEFKGHYTSGERKVFLVKQFSMSIITNNIKYYYNTGTPYSKLALDGINIEICKGEFVGIIGPAEAGKTTLLQHFNGLLEPSSGNIEIDGRQVSGYYNIFRKVGFVWQFPEEQFFADTVYEEIAFGPANIGFNSDYTDSLVNGAMKTVGLDFERFGRRSPFTLSVGEMRRCAVASVLAMNTEIIIFDELLSGLDEDGRDKIIGCLNQAHSEGRTIIYASRQDEISQFCGGRIIYMDKGRVIT